VWPTAAVEPDLVLAGLADLADLVDAERSGR
jgi:hypothetical protein